MCGVSKFDPELRAIVRKEVARLYEDEDLSMNQIVAHLAPTPLKISFGMVRRLLIESGVPLRPPGNTKTLRVRRREPSEAGVA